MTKRALFNIGFTLPFFFWVIASSVAAQVISERDFEIALGRMAELTQQGQYAEARATGIEMLDSVSEKQSARLMAMLQRISELQMGDKTPASPSTETASTTKPKPVIKKSAEELTNLINGLNSASNNSFEALIPGNTPSVLDHDEILDYLMNWAKEYVEIDFSVREDYWRGEGNYEKPGSIVYNFYKNNEYVFLFGVSTDTRTQKIEVHITDSSGNVVMTSSAETGRMRALVFKPTTNGKYQIVFNVKGDPSQEYAWVMSYMYR